MGRIPFPDTGELPLQSTCMPGSIKGITTRLINTLLCILVILCFILCFFRLSRFCRLARFTMADPCNAASASDDSE